MTVSYCKASLRGGKYYTDGLDGSTTNETLRAEWAVCGPGADTFAEFLGISDGQQFGRTDPAKFLALVAGYCPNSSKGDRPLVQNAGRPKRVGLHDFTVSAPKSVSVIWALADDRIKRQIEEAQTIAARAFVRLLGERASLSRSGKAGAIKSACPIVCSLFLHSTSRLGDPQIHTHCVIPNLTLRADGTTASIETRLMMCWVGAAACTYHAELAFQLQRLGLQIELAGNLFEVMGVPQNVRDEFSKRRAEILVAAENDRPSGEDDVRRRRRMRRLVILTRGPKISFLHSKLQHQWDLRAKALGFGRRDVRMLFSREKSAGFDAAMYSGGVLKIGDELRVASNRFAVPRFFARSAALLIGKAASAAIGSLVDAAVAELRHDSLQSEDNEEQDAGRQFLSRMGRSPSLSREG
jgi:conjugative relaxase-like TrwC/TraI family protein